MKLLLIAALVLGGQMISHQDKPVVHLRPHTDTIDAAFGGSILELSQSPPVIHLPAPPPKPDADGNQWAIDVKNCGPSAVTIADRANFSVVAGIGQTVHIDSNGAIYFLKH